MKKSERKLSTPYTFLKCQTCKISKKRKFEDGDIVFSVTQNCSDCENGICIHASSPIGLRLAE